MPRVLGALRMLKLMSTEDSKMRRKFSIFRMLKLLSTEDRCFVHGVYSEHLNCCLLKIAHSIAHSTRAARESFSNEEVST